MEEGESPSGSPFSEPIPEPGLLELVSGLSPMPGREEEPGVIAMEFWALSSCMVMACISMEVRSRADCCFRDWERPAIAFLKHCPDLEEEGWEGCCMASIADWASCFMLSDI